MLAGIMEIVRPVVDHLSSVDVPEWDYAPCTSELLSFYADLGDAQM